MRINQNIAAFNAYRNLSVTDAALGKSLEKRSSGFRLHDDGAARLAESEGLRAEIRGNRQAIRNAEDGVSFVQTAEGALDRVHSILQRMRELAVDAANTATTDGSAQQAEITELLADMDAIGASTTFAGNTVLSDYSVVGNELIFDVGAYSGSQLQISNDLTLGQADVFGVDVGTVDVSGNADTAIGTIDGAIDAVSTERATLRATRNRLEHVIANLGVAVENVAASESRVRDADTAFEMINFTRNQITTRAGTAMLAQADQVPFTVLSLLQ
jgi:flagellin